MYTMIQIGANRHKFQQGKFWLDIREKIHSEGGLEQIAKRRCGISVFVEIQNLTGQDTDQPDLAPNLNLVLG